MKYAWIEETEVVQVELFDGEGNPFDPPQYEDVTQGTNSGPVVGLNRGPQEGEKGGTITPQHLVWGMDNEAYEVIDGNFTPLDEAQYAQLESERQAERDAQADALAQLEARVALLEAEKESEGIHKYTPEQIRNYIDNISSLDEIKTVLKKIAIYILK